MEENNNQNENQNVNNNSTVETNQNQVVEPVVNQNTTTNQAENVNPNPYQTAPKATNKNTGLIVVIIILILIIIGGGVYGFITINDLNKKIAEKDEQLASKTASDALGSLMDVFNKDDDKDDDNDDNEDDSDKLKNVISKDDDKNKDDNTDKDNQVDQVSGEAKASTKENPLSLGEWGLAAKYVSKNLSKNYEGKSYTDVPVRVTKVTRGSEAETKVKEWFNNQSFYKYQDPKEGTEWAVVDYEVDLSKVSFDEGTIGTSTEVSSAVKGLDGLGVKYNGFSYILSTTNTTSKDYVKKPGVYKCQFIVTLPKGCTDYLVVLGNSHNGSESYFRCEK